MSMALKAVGFVHFGVHMLPMSSSSNNTSSPCKIKVEIVVVSLRHIKKVCITYQSIRKKENKNIVFILGNSLLVGRMHDNCNCRLGKNYSQPLFD